MLRRLALFFLAAAFLAAQAAGVAHQVWHDATPVVAEADQATSDGKAPQKSLLCEFHGALACVLGAIHGAAVTPQVVAERPVAFIAVGIPAARFTSLHPLSRAPPAAS